MVFDKRDEKTLCAAVNSGHFGPTIFKSRSLGKSWENSEPQRFSEGSGPTVEHVWHAELGHANEHGVVYAGVAPAAPFMSEDAGKRLARNFLLYGFTVLRRRSVRR